MEELQDIYNRKFKALRVSVLETCNFKCTYCTMGSENGDDYDHRPQQPASFFINRIKRLNKLLHLENIRLTGGEPLLYRELPELVKGILNTGIEDIKMTSNGFLLEKQALVLKQAGLKSINISLDAIDETVFQKMSRRKKGSQVLRGIDTALDSGLNVKLNAVIMKGYNENQLFPLLEYAFSKNLTIRFLEVMGMGHLHRQQANYLMKQEEILGIIAHKYQFSRLIRKKSATANYWETTTGNSFGIIANNSAPFCSDCNRLRMDTKGNLYGCLSSNKGFYFTETDQDSLLHQKLQHAMWQKQLQNFTGSPLSMLKIGG